MVKGLVIIYKQPCSAIKNNISQKKITIYKIRKTLDKYVRGVRVNKIIYTYALIKCLYDKGKDYIDSFLPFVLRVIPSEIFVNLAFIQKELNKKFELDIPRHVLRTILVRARKVNYIQKKEKKFEYKLTSDGFNLKEKLEEEHEVERRINALIEDIRKFFLSQDISLNYQQIYDLLVSFLRKNIEPLILYLNPSISIEKFIVKNPESYEKILVEYFKLADEQKPRHYETLKELVMGSIISVILYTQESTDIDAIQTQKFKQRRVFLDTNFVFSLLGLHTREFEVATQELFNLLKQYNFEIKVFDFTVNEICQVIGGYLGKAHRYSRTVGVDTIYSSLKRKGWEKSDAREFITNIESILQEHEITIELTDVDLKRYEPSNKSFRKLIAKYKPLQLEFNQNHDLAAIELISKFRGRSIRKIENSKACFLTADLRLSKFNFLEMGHKENGTVNEAIIDRLMTTFLWLKNPKVDISLKSIIAAHSRDLFVQRGVWERFYDILQQLVKEKKVEDRDISMLFYHNYIEDVLREFDEFEADQLTTEFVLEKIEEATRFYEEEFKKRQKIIEQKASLKIQEKEEEFIKKIKEKDRELLELEKKEQEWLEKESQIKNSLKTHAKKRANIYSIICSSIMLLWMALALYAIYLEIKTMENYEFWMLLISISFGGSGFFGLWKKFRGWLKERWEEQIYFHRIEEVKLSR